MAWGESSAAFDYRSALDTAVDKLETLTGYRVDVNAIGNQTFRQWWRAEHVSPDHRSPNHGDPDHGDPA